MAGHTHLCWFSLTHKLSYFKHSDLCHSSLFRLLQLSHTHTHTPSATVQDMSGSIKHLNTRAVEQIAGIQQGRVGSKSRDRIAQQRGEGGEGGVAGQVRRAVLIFRSISASAQPGFEADSVRPRPEIETLEQDDGRIRAEQRKANEVKFS